MGDFVNIVCTLPFFSDTGKAEPFFGDMWA